MPDCQVSLGAMPTSVQSLAPSPVPPPVPVLTEAAASLGAYCCVHAARFAMLFASLATAGGTSSPSARGWLTAASVAVTGTGIGIGTDGACGGWGAVGGAGGAVM